MLAGVAIGEHRPDDGRRAQQAPPEPPAGNAQGGNGEPRLALVVQPAQLAGGLDNPPGTALTARAALAASHASVSPLVVRRPAQNAARVDASCTAPLATIGSSPPECA